MSANNNSSYGTRPFENDLGDRISDLREERGESQADMAAALKLSQRTTVEHWEKGTRLIKAGQLAEIAKHFNVSADYLLGLSDVRTPETELRSVCEYTGLSEDAVSCLRNILVNICSKDQKDKTDELCSVINKMLSDCAFYVLVMEIQILYEAYKDARLEELLTPSEEKRDIAASEASKIMGMPVNVISGEERVDLFKNKISRNSVHLAEKIASSMLKEYDAIMEKAIEMLRNGGET